MHAFMLAHPEVLLLIAYVYSATMSTMPPLPDGAGFFAVWAHNLLQFAAANPYKFHVAKASAAALKLAASPSNLIAE